MKAIKKKVAKPEVSGQTRAGLFARYAEIFKAAWNARAELLGPDRLADELAFLPAALALQETPPHPATRRTAMVICALVMISLLWTYFSELDIVAVAKGRVKVSDGSKLIQALETSVVKAIYVKDGDKVKAGSTLIELDMTLPVAEIARVQQEQQATLAESARAKALGVAIIHNSKPQLNDPSDQARLDQTTRASAIEQMNIEWDDINAKRSKLQAEATKLHAEQQTVEQQIAKIQAILPLLMQREHDYQALTTQGFVSQHAGQDRSLDRINQERDLATLIARRSEAFAAVREGEENAHAFFTETQRTLQERVAQADLKLKQLAESAIKAQQRQALTRLTAPVNGTVQQLAVHTAGGVVTPAQVLLMVVPLEASITAEVILENKDMGFVREGQNAEIKFDAFPYSSYGTVQAQVLSIGADATLDEKRGAVFTVLLALKKKTITANGKQFKIVPGMDLVAELKTGKRTVFEYLLQPIRQTSSESLQER